MTTPCILCGNTENNQLYQVKELQMGLNEYFDYQLCGACGSMQLQNVPADLGKYYPNEDYYSFKHGTQVQKADTLRRIKTEYLLFGRNRLAGGLLSIGYRLPEELQWMKDLHAQYNDKILDIGTGNGSLLMRLLQVGFTNLTGIDPFINENQQHGPVRILKKNIYQLEESFDLIMMHHSLEHMSEPQKVMAQAMRILKPGGRLMIRVPVMGHYGWQQYGVHWGGIDGPRHIFIPSEKQLKVLGKNAGFIIEKFYYDSPVSMIWMSEQHRNNMHLYHPNSYIFRSPDGMFTKKDIKKFRAILDEENKKDNGDTAVMVLCKP